MDQPANVCEYGPKDIRHYPKVENPPCVSVGEFKVGHKDFKNYFCFSICNFLGTGYMYLSSNLPRLVLYWGIINIKSWKLLTILNFMTFYKNNSNSDAWTFGLNQPSSL